MNSRFLIPVLFLLFPFAAQSQCTGSFTWQSNFTAAFFDGTVTPQPGPNTTYYWWFSDNGNYATVQDPNYAFSQPGTYTVCFSFYDPASGCSDSVCQQVTVTSTCSADFTWMDSLGFTVFNGSSTMSTPVNWFWDFGDGNYGGANEEWHNYANPGTYTVCLYTYDQNQNFCDSTCHTVVVTSSGCNADFTWLDTLGYTYFISSTTAAGAQYFWDFGDGNYSYQQNPSNVYWNAGTYTVCLTVYDSLQNFCDSTCHTITVQGSGGCNADFTWIDSLGHVFFISSSTIGSAGYYIWDFGDGNYSYTANPSHQYASPGFYTVCLTVLDSLQNFCDSVCYTVLVQTVNIEENTLQNSISASPNPADATINLSFLAASAGDAHVSFYDAAGRITNKETIAVHGAGIVNTEINTTNMPEGIYLVKIEVNGFVAWKRIALTHQ